MEDSKKSAILINDEKYMRIALELAQKGKGSTNPNPMVGAVIVKNGEIIGRGYHEKYGGLHAERNALANCKKLKKSPEGATMHVTLEPCCHYGKTPPCTEALLKNKIARVVIGTEDPNTLVTGKGIKLLKDAGVEVVTGILEKECQGINNVYFKYMLEKRPFVAMKYAMTADGKIATYMGKSKWITGEEAREHVHGLRDKYTGIMVGIGTVLADDPLLTCRISNNHTEEHQNVRTPIRIICDTNLRIPMECKIVETASTVKTYLATASSNHEKIGQLTEKGCNILQVQKQGEHIDLKELMTILEKEGIDSVLLEGGGTLNFEALQSDIVDYVYAYIAPKIFGGVKALTPVEGKGTEIPHLAYKLKVRRTEFLGEDLLIEYERYKDKEEMSGCLQE